MPDQPGPDPAEESQSGATHAAGSAQPNAPHSDEPRPWGRDDRNRLLLWVVIAFALPVPFVLLLHLWIKPTGSVFTIQSELPTKAIIAFFVVLATWFMSRKEKRPLDDYGIPLRQAFGERFWEGCIWGFAALSALLLVLFVSGHFQIDSVALSGGAIFRYAVGWAAVFLAVSVSEEFAFRGYWLFSFSRRMRFWPAALFTSVVFGAAHLGNPGENLLGILQVIVVGLLLCLTLRRTGNLWFALGFHAAWDWAETFFYGTPDSGLLGAGRFLSTSVHGPKAVSSYS